MKLFYLYKIEGMFNADYDIQCGCVVRAEHEWMARKIASMTAGDEGRDVWLNTDCTTCEELTADGDPELILQDFNAA